MKYKLKKNGLFILSAAAYHILLLRFHLPYLISGLAAMVAVIAVAVRIPDLCQMAMQKRIEIRIWALLAAFAFVPANSRYFMERTLSSEKILSLIHVHVPGGMQSARIFVWLVALAAVWFWFVVMCFLCNWLYETMRDIFRQCSKVEMTVFSLLVLLTGCLLVYVFGNTSAFYEECIVYTADSGALISPNAYLVIAHFENDLRQPLFAVFASPFIGPFYLVGLLLPANLAALFIALVQLPVLFASCLMIARLLTPDPGCRTMFLVVMGCTYPVLLFSMMLEQYIISVFWLILFLYTAILRKKDRQFVLVGAAGTLITSVAAGVFLEEKPEELLKNLTQSGLKGLLLLTFFGRLDVLVNFQKGMELSRFAGGVTWEEKLLQYLSFVESCLVAPAAEIRSEGSRMIWSLQKADAVNMAGVLILLLAAGGFWLNRQERLVQISAFWILFSWLIIFVIGWGTPENGTILYALYFGWAFVVLLYKLLESILDRLKFGRLMYPVGVAACAVLLAANIPAILQLLAFTAVYSPLH